MVMRAKTYESHRINRILSFKSFNTSFFLASAKNQNDNNKIIDYNLYLHPTTNPA